MQSVQSELLIEQSISPAAEPALAKSPAISSHNKSSFIHPPFLSLWDGGNFKKQITNTVRIVKQASHMLTIFIVTRAWSALHSKNSTTTRHEHRSEDSVHPPLGKYSLAELKIINSMNESFEWKMQLIETANTSIEWSLNYAGGEKFQEALRTIQTQLEKKPGLRVHLLLSNDLLDATDRRALRNLAQDDRFTYIITKQRFCLRPFPHTKDNHVKLLVVDSKYFVLGGSGVHALLLDPDANNHYTGEPLIAKTMPNGCRDLDIVGCGRIAETMRQHFFTLFMKWENKTTKVAQNRFFEIDASSRGTCEEFDTATDLFKNVKIKIFVSGSENRFANPITSQLVKRIRKSTNKIQLASLVLNPPLALRTALAEKRGQVNIVGYTGGFARSPSWGGFLQMHLSRNRYSFFDEVYEYERRQTMFHKKVATFDNRYTTIGSYNLGIKSAYCDDEILCTIKDEEVTAAINDSLFSDSEQSIPRNTRSISWLSRLIGKILFVTSSTFTG